MARIDRQNAHVHVIDEWWFFSVEDAAEVHRQLGELLEVRASLVTPQSTMAARLAFARNRPPVGGV